MNLSQYIEALSARFKKGDATEHTYRGDLQQLIESMVPGVMATNEPTRIACGAPDYIITKKEIPLGYIEAKDIDVDLNSKTLKEQFDRYRHSLDNLIFTNYLDFHFYKRGEQVTSIRIAKTEGNKITPLADRFDGFTALLKDFCSYTGQTIKSSKSLAEMMAGKARMLANVIENAINRDEENAADSSLKEQMNAFKDMLIHDITAKEFSDIYAQTVAYGMFAARLHDRTLDNFTRQEAAELIPKSNPFLRKLFGYIAGPDIDVRIVWIVDALADIFRAADVATLLKDFGKATKQEDPIIHFYETFLAEYDPKLRKARGVWYTPAPVVNFIVRAVDDILKTEFNLADGLADKRKIKIKTKAFTKATADKRSKVKEVENEQEVHKVQILDPATGTGTFLAEVIKQVHKKFEGQQGVWSNYVEEHLVPRLNGFELLMASYAMAHLKLDLLLTETGYKPKKQNRLRVYLTNSLEEHHPDTGTLFASWLSSEANEANHIKRDTPVMVIIGNPPYAVSSSNASVDNDGKKTWIGKLIDEYKKDLNEKKINIDDDYIKFIRYGEHFIEKNGEGILAYISNNSFIDGVTHRQMRKHLLETFDKIYILDLHGSAKKNETTRDGSKDENVFDIQQGVSINLFVKTNKKKKEKLGRVSHFDLHGLREVKYDTLLTNNLKKIKWNELQYKEPYYFFVPKDFSESESYEKGFKIDELFSVVNNGIKTDRDNLFVDFEKNNVVSKFNILLGGEIPKSFIDEYRVVDSGSFKITSRIKSKVFKDAFIRKLLYRPFDVRYIYYDPSIVSRPAQKVMKHVKNDNISILSCRQQSTFDFQHVLVSKELSEVCTVSLQTKETTYVFPLYLYEENSNQKNLYDKQERTPNLNKEIVSKIAESLGLEFTNEKDPSTTLRVTKTFAPIDLLDYIYAVLHSPTYREKYKEFLKIDFPRVPYPTSPQPSPKERELAREKFWQLVKLGGELRQIHLLESPVVNKPITKYPVDGDNLVSKVKASPNPSKGGELVDVYINETQYFKDVPLVAWEFYIGGYQPAQKWLKDRKERALSFDDIGHYQKIIIALSETDRLMKEIGEIKIA